MLKILIIEDDLEFVKNIFNYIKLKNEKDYVITNIITNGEEAYTYLMEHMPDVIILDLQLPKLNGEELLLKLSENKNLPKIIVSTGDASMLHRILKLNINIESVFVKPYNYDRIFEKLEEIKNEHKIIKIDNLVVDELSNFYFNKSSQGYFYIIDCIRECILQDKLVTPFETNLYSIIAAKNKVKSKLHIKWAIDKSINAINKYTNHETLYKYFSDNKVTSKIFINEIFQRVYYKINNFE